MTIDPRPEPLRSPLLDRAGETGIRHGFFTRRGFEPIGEHIVDPDVYSQLLRSGDAGVEEFLDLAHVKPNTLGNTRMLKHLV